MTTAPVSGGRRRQLIGVDLAQSTVPGVCDAQPVTEATCRIEAASSLLSYALVGEIPLDLAAGGAVRLLARAQRYLEVPA